MTKKVINFTRKAALRTATAKTIERVAAARLPTETGEFRIIGFRSLVSSEEFVAVVKGELNADRASLVRIHSQCMTGDVFGSIKCDCGRQLEAAMKLIESEGHGAIVYQQQEGRGIGIINKIRAYALQDQGADTIEANERLGFEADLRSYDQCAEILLELGLRTVRVMSDNPAKIQALRNAGLEVVERVPLEVEPHDFFVGYLKTKKEKMGHLVSVA
ncbi:MAG TPA: GTP cyclohydrolase II [Pyrinomonadaceae bacterium]|nr:GTP cyclohydrolase II [Pyrinomonadaceae bacterium]